MYTVKPILTRFDIETPKCMYNMKPNNNTNQELSADDFLARLSTQVDYLVGKDNADSMAALAERQDIILEKLKELQGQLVSMKSAMRICAKPAQNQFKPAPAPAGKPQGRTQPKVSVRDVVINVNPDFLPLSFPLLQKLWRKNLHLVFSFHTHSSVSTISAETLAYQRAVEEESAKNDKDVVFKIIWKNSGGSTNPEMILSPIDHVPIHSEVNILRFLSRIGPDYYNFEQKPNVNCLDKIFDICFKLANVETEGERSQLILLLVNYLGSSVDKDVNDVSLVDLAVYSSLARNRKSLPKASVQKLTKWLKSVETYCERSSC